MTIATLRRTATTAVTVVVLGGTVLATAASSASAGGPQGPPHGHRGYPHGPYWDHARGPVVWGPAAVGAGLIVGGTLAAPPARRCYVEQVRYYNRHGQLIVRNEKVCTR